MELGTSPRDWWSVFTSTAFTSTAPVVASALAAVALYAWSRRWLDRRRRRRTALSARVGERRAAHLLRAAGFRVLEEQAQTSWVITRDGIELAMRLSADYLVERDGRLWVAEVKTGQLVANLRHGPTRRQLLEYQHAFKSDGLLLVDVERDKVVRVQFPGVAVPSAPRQFGLRSLWLAALTGAAFSLWIVRFNPF